MQCLSCCSGHRKLPMMRKDVAVPLQDAAQRHRTERLLRVFEALDSSHRGRMSKKHFIEFTKAVGYSDVGENFASLGLDADGDGDRKRRTFHPPRLWAIGLLSGMIDKSEWITFWTDRYPVRPVPAAPGAV